MSAKELAGLITLGVFTVAYVVYHYAAAASVWQARGCNQTEAILRQRTWGGVILGLPALCLWVLLDAGPIYVLGHWRPAVLFIAFVMLVVWPSIWAAARKPHFADDVPLIREFPWDRNLKIKNALAWVFYLLGYELMFRGALLFGLTKWIGPYGAAAVVTAIYVAVHLPKPWPETVGCIPMGLAFAAVSLYSGSFLGAFVGHALIALFSDTQALRLRDRLSHDRDLR